MSGTVLVTGGSGFVAGHLVRQLLTRGYTVRASVRDLANAAKVDPLRRTGEAFPGRLEVFEADLLRPGSFDEAMRDCRFVFHVASPFLMPEQIRDARHDVLEPALEGTRNVIAGINRTPTVQRLVLTSTVGAIFGDYVDVLDMKDATLTEEYFNTSSTLQNNPYHYAKTVAEREAWDAVRTQDRWSMVAVNPGLILGPALTATSESGSLFLMDELMSGYFFYGAPNFSFTFVDVRDVADAHIRAAELDSASGRYILARPEMVSFARMANIIRDRHPRRLLVPRHTVYRLGGTRPRAPLRADEGLHPQASRDTFRRRQPAQRRGTGHLLPERRRDGPGSFRLVAGPAPGPRRPPPRHDPPLPSVDYPPIRTNLVRRIADRRTSVTTSLPFDPIGEATRLWRAHGWDKAADGMAAVTSLMRAQAIVQTLVDDVLRPLGLSFARYELLMLLSFTREGCLPMTKARVRLQVHPTSVTSAVSRLESAGLVIRRPDPRDGRGVLVGITDQGRKVAREATTLLNEEVFGRPELNNPRMLSLIDILRDLRREAGDFEP